ncbi:hypothetical protein CYMTET_3842, partial [Cymbomonas tetramitiformis]
MICECADLPPPSDVAAPNPPWDEITYAIPDDCDAADPAMVSLDEEECLNYYNEHVIAVPALTYTSIDSADSPVGCYAALSTLSIYFNEATSGKKCSDDDSAHCLCKHQAPPPPVSTDTEETGTFTDCAIDAYIRVDSGTCSSNGYETVDSSEECQALAVNSDRRFESVSSSGNSAGCNMPPDTWITYNRNSESPAECITDSACLCRCPSSAQSDSDNDTTTDTEETSTDDTTTDDTEETGTFTDCAIDAYIRVDSGTCSSNGYETVDSSEECQALAVNSDRRFESVSSSGNSAGCNMPPDTWITYNRNSESPAECITDSACLCRCPSSAQSDSDNDTTTDTGSTNHTEETSTDDEGATSGESSNSKTYVVSSTVTFSDLDISAFANPEFDTTFRSEYISQIEDYLTEMTIPFTEVVITNIKSGSTAVESAVSLDSPS